MSQKPRTAGGLHWQAKAPGRPRTEQVYSKSRRKSRLTIQCAVGEVRLVPQSTTDAAGSVSTGKALYINVGRGPVVAGSFYDDDRSFRRSAKVSHLLRQPPAIALQQELVDKLQELDCRELIISVAETNTRYRCTMNTFVRHSIPLNRGFGMQVSLAFEHWTIENMAQPRLPFGDEEGGLS